MRAISLLLVMSAWAAAGIAHAQTAAQAVQSQQTASQPATSGSAATRAPAAAHPAGRAHPKRQRARSATAVTNGGAPAAKGDGVLTLGASDITGNKELPKVMVIVPWKGPAEAGGVVAPTDSVMNEVLGPVDRSVFQRRIRYYGQLNAAGERPAAQPVAPVGDSR